MFGKMPSDLHNGENGDRYYNAYSTTIAIKRRAFYFREYINRGVFFLAKDTSYYSLNTIKHFGARS